MSKICGQWSLMVTILFLQLFVSGLADAAAIGLSTDKSELSINGEIQLGDAERVVALILASRVVDKEGRGVYQLQNVSINSRGGDVDEALKVASVIRAAYLNLSVRGETKGKPSVCASACFFVYLAAYSRHANGADVKTDWNFDFSQGVVGLHRPYFLDPNGGLASQARQEEAMRLARTLLQQEGVSHQLIDEMMSRPSNDIYWLSQRDIDSIGEFKPSVEEELISKCGYKRRSLLTDAEIASVERTRNVGACKAKIWWKTYWPMENAALEKMRQGWRPWQPK